MNRFGAWKRDLALRVAGDARCSRACEINKCIAANKVATEGRVGCSGGVADALHRLELYLACHQDRITRSPADFIRGDSFSHRNYRAGSGFIGPNASAPANAQRLCRSRCNGGSHVRGELHAAVLGGIARFIRSRCSAAGNDPDFRYDVRPLDAAG